MKHYYHPMSRAVTTDWMLQELDVEHEQIVVDFTAGETATRLVTAGDPEDGYSGIDVARRADVFRDGAAINYIVVTDEDREFWSFRPLSSPVPPQEYNAAWSRGAIDDFIAAKHRVLDQARQ